MKDVQEFILSKLTVYYMGIDDLANLTGLRHGELYKELVEMEQKHLVSIKKEVKSIPPVDITSVGSEFKQYLDTVTTVYVCRCIWDAQ